MNDDVVQAIFRTQDMLANKIDSVSTDVRSLREELAEQRGVLRGAKLTLVGLSGACGAAVTILAKISGFIHL